MYSCLLHKGEIKKQTIKSRGKEIVGERRRSDAGAGEHQLDVGTKIDADVVTHHCKHRLPHMHEQTPSFTKGWDPPLC